MKSSLFTTLLTTKMLMKNPVADDEKTVRFAYHTTPER
jgi:hypothetical protein